MKPRLHARVSRGEVTRPLVRWHGGKWMLAPWIISHFLPHRIYCEPFGGGGSVLLRKTRSWHEVYNDVSGDIVNLFRVARDDGKRLSDSLSLTPFSRDEFKLSYQPSDDDLERARRLVVRCFMGFGSNAHERFTGFRSFVRGQGTSVGTDWMNYPDALKNIIKRLQGVVVENRDAIEVIVGQDSHETLHYVDPPYLPETRDKGKDYAKEMTDLDHERLLLMLRDIKGQVVLSGYRSEMYIEILHDWACHEKSSHADGGRKRIECIWTNRESRQGDLFL